MSELARLLDECESALDAAAVAYIREAEAAWRKYRAAVEEASCATAESADAYRSAIGPIRDEYLIAVKSAEQDLHRTREKALQLVGEQSTDQRVKQIVQAYANYPRHGLWALETLL